jgi:hypothetical protein
MLRIIWQVTVRFIGKLRRGLSVIVFLLMLAFTVASHTVQAVSDFVTNSIEVVMGTTTLVSDAISGRNAARKKVSAQEKRILNLKAENAKLQRTSLIELDGRPMKSSDAVNQTVQKVQGRTKRVASANVASAFGESIPFYGIGIIAAATTYELYSACETMQDLHDLQEAINPALASEAERDYVCGLPKPTTEELIKAFKNSPQTAWQGAVSALNRTSDWASGLEAPDFSGSWTRAVEWFANRF